jgi:putative membrane protein
MEATMTKHRTIILVAAALLLPSLAAAQPAATKTETRRGEMKSEGKGALSGADRTFVLDAAKSGMAEVNLGKLAAERGSSTAVKQFGERMATDHAKANDELEALAQQKGLTLPAEVDARHRQLHDRLAKLSGGEFDRAYIEAMVKDHRKDVGDFRRQAQGAKDPDLKAWAGKTLPTLENHFKQVQQIQTQLKGRAAR